MFYRFLCGRFNALPRAPSRAGEGRNDKMRCPLPYPSPAGAGAGKNALRGKKTAARGRSGLIAYRIHRTKRIRIIIKK